MLETIHEVALESLGNGQEATRVRRSHCERMIAIARSANLTDDGLVTGPQRHELVLSERDDMDAALDWAAVHDVHLGLELAVALEAYAIARDPAEAARRVGDLLARADSLPPHLLAAALRVHGGGAYRSVDFVLGRRLHAESLAAYRLLGDEHRAANLLARIAVDASWSGQLREARLLAEELRERGRALDMPRLEAEGLGALSTIHHREGDLEGAWELSRRSAEAAAACGFVWWQANMLGDQLELALKLGRLDEAELAGREALRMAVTMDERLLKLWALIGLALIARARGDLGAAGRLWGAIGAETAIEPPPQEQNFLEFSAPLAELSDPRFLAASASGREVGLEAAISLALGEDQMSP
jgi:hypothetical protein